MINIITNLLNIQFGRLFLCSVLTIGFLYSCSKDVLEEDVNYPISINRPSNFPEIQYNLVSNPPTKYGIELGRRLFYEGKLSADNGTSCAFCHIQENAFTHHGHSISHGVFDRIGFRNAPPIQNMIFLKNYTWDGAITDLTIQPIVPITTHEEMGENFPEIINKLRQTNDYPTLFKKSYGSEEITADKILKALGQFMATMVSANSKYDKVIRNEDGIKFTEDELKGKEIFKQKCSSCHATDLFTDQSFRNTGLVYNPSLADYGRFRVTDSDRDKMKFRVPSLRNIALTAPYMHDGRFYTLDAVLNHYTDGVQDNSNLDPLLKSNGKTGIPMTPLEKQLIITFLKTLTDNDFITNKKFSEFP